MQKINLYTVTSGTDIAERTKEIFKEEKRVNFAGLFTTLNETTKFLKGKPVKEPAILFINDYLFKKDNVLKFVSETTETSILAAYKKILYTKSINKNYIKNLSNSNINGILHKLDTPLFVNQNRNLLLLKQGKEKLIKIIKLVSGGCTFYDSKIIFLLPQRYAWARNETASDFSIPVREEILDWQLKENAETALQKIVPFIKRLTIREREILLLIADGKKNIDIAQKLNISVTTVEAHKVHMLKKLALKSTTNLLIFAIRNEIILKFLSAKNF